MGREWIDSKGAAVALAPGLDVRKNGDGSETIRIRFRYKGVQCPEIIGPATAANVKLAAAKLAAVKAAMNLGTFDYAKEFPQSSRVRQLSDRVVSGHTFASWVKTWLDDRLAKGKIKLSTKLVYENLHAQHWLPKLGNVRLSDVRDTHILDVVKEALKEGLVRNTLNVLLSSVRGAFAYAKAMKEIDTNPFRDIEMGVVLEDAGESDYEVLPFTPAEKDALYQAALKRHPTCAEMIPFWMWTGLRACELVALRWSDVEVKTGRCTVSHALTRVGSTEYADKPGAKTESSVRTFPLTQPALEALERQRKHSLMLTPGRDGVIFPNPNDGKPWVRPTSPRQMFITLCVDAGVAFRNPEQCRHTFGTTMLDRGEDARDVAEWMGHKDVEMLLRIYGRRRVLEGKRDGDTKRFKNTSNWR